MRSADVSSCVACVKNRFNTFLLVDKDAEQRALDGLIPTFLSSEPPSAVGYKTHRLGEEEQQAFTRRRASNYSVDDHQNFFSYCVQFKRIWCKARGGSPYGIWKPMVPENCFSLGDVCLQGNYPPEKSLCMHKCAGNLIAQPLSFVQVWSNDRSTASHMLSIWKPVAPEGYVTLGYVFHKGSEAPHKDTICCVHSSLATSCKAKEGFAFSGGRHNMKLLSAGALTYTFELCNGEEQRTLQTIDAQQKSDKDKRANQEITASTVCGNVHLEISDSLQTPVLSLLYDDICVNLRGVEGESEIVCTFNSKLSSFNRQLQSWEPILEDCGFLIKVANKSSMLVSSLLPSELKVQIRATSDIHGTISYDAIESAIFLLSQWNDMSQREKLCIEEDSSSINTTLTNCSGGSLYLKLNFGDGTHKIERIDERQLPYQISQPFTLDSSLKSSQGARTKYFLSFSSLLGSKPIVPRNCVAQVAHLA